MAQPCHNHTITDISTITITADIHAGQLHGNQYNNFVIIIILWA